MARRAPRSARGRSSNCTSDAGERTSPSPSTATSGPLAATNVTPDGASCPRRFRRPWLLLRSGGSTRRARSPPPGSRCRKLHQSPARFVIALDDHDHERPLILTCRLAVGGRLVSSRHGHPIELIPTERLTPTMCTMALARTSSTASSKTSAPSNASVPGRVESDRSHRCRFTRYSRSPSPKGHRPRQTEMRLVVVRSRRHRTGTRQMPDPAVAGRPPWRGCGRRRLSPLHRQCRDVHHVGVGRALSDDARHRKWRRGRV